MRLESLGLMVNGAVQTNRYLRSAAGHPPGLCGQTSTFRAGPARRSWRNTSPPRLPEPDAVDQTMLESAGSGVAQPLSPPATECHMPRGIVPAPPKPPSLLLLGPRVEGPSCRLPIT